ncbi:hypothetical protein K435DRAFT_867372 [Dendrothele bispora CBS 962.96]|uniref:Uncharacterized protein n=1 Tax=Dendrothele bispora (strain CBS 962.96) TaxID=1314807 RepID=A0A4S8LF90_DENBC|nr:hypothetical protein K435DRAFT_867372 [Dendrothele bispora CBS 962.96]
MLALRNRRVPSQRKFFPFLFCRKHFEDYRPNFDLAPEAISPAKKRCRVHFSRIIPQRWKGRQYWEFLAKEKKKKPNNPTRDTVPGTLTSDNENTADSNPIGGSSRNLSDINRYTEQDSRMIGRNVESWGGYYEVNYRPVIVAIGPVTVVMVQR